MKLTIYGIKSCDTCREAMKWFDEYSVDYKFHDLRRDGLEVQMLERWSDNLGWEKLLNKRSLTWRRIPDADRDELSRGRAIALMMEHPTLIKRPLLERRKFVAVGFSPEDYKRVFKV